MVKVKGWTDGVVRDIYLIVLLTKGVNSKVFS
jgi:hypothetical protein